MPARRASATLLGLLLGGAPTAARASDVHQQLTLTPGLQVSFTFGAGGGLGIGPRVSLVHQWRDEWSDEPFRGLGAFLEYARLFRPDGPGRFAFGGLASYQMGEGFTPGPGAGAALGWVPAANALHVEGFSSARYVGIGLRGTLPGLDGGGGDLAITASAGIPLVLTRSYAPVVGRPLRRGPTVQVAQVLALDAPAPPVHVTGQSSDREHLRDRWLSDARSEDASIPAFLQLWRDLADVGAPSHLRDACLRAAHDESRHAALCFALASAYGERRYRAKGPVAGFSTEARAKDRPAELARLAVESLVDGALGEGVAASVADRRASDDRDAHARAASASIAADEHRHAELAWAVIDWCLAEDAETVRPALRRALERARDERSAADEPELAGGVLARAATRLA